jgi:hypothetical protein
MTASGCPAKLIILDACRSFRFAKGDTEGLAPATTVYGTLIAYSTAPGKIARDSPNASNSVYTSNLVQAITQLESRGAAIEEVLKVTGRAVFAQTRQQQDPNYTSNLHDDLFLFPAKAAKPRPTETPAMSQLSPRDLEAIRAMIRDEVAAKVSSTPIVLPNGNLSPDVARRSDIEPLRKMLGAIETEINVLGVDVDATKKRISSLERRVTEVEKRKSRIF